MGKWVHDNVMDAALEDIADNGNIMHVCSADPVNYAGIAGVTLGNVALATGIGGGVYTKGAGDISGRKLTVAQQTITGTGDGNGTHVVIADTVGTEIKCVTTCTSYAISNGVNFVVSAYDAWEINDPT